MTMYRRRIWRTLLASAGIQRRPTLLVNHWLIYRRRCAGLRYKLLSTPTPAIRTVTQCTSKQNVFFIVAKIIDIDIWGHYWWI